MRRGIGLEKLLARLFRRNHYQVRLSPGSALPRQSDLLAKDISHTFLVEAKWRHRAAEIGDVDSLYQRLRDASGGFVGVLVSIAGFSRRAVNRVENRRDLPIVLIAGQELDPILDEPTELKPLLLRKLDALLTHGRALVAPQPLEEAGVTDTRVALASSKKRFLLPGGKSVRYLSCAGGFSPLVFSQRIEDIDWVTSGGAGVALDVTVPSLDQESLIDLLEELSAIGWATERAHWTLHQAVTNWHGFGAKSLATALRAWRVRYRDVESIHHTETLAYYDVCPGGFYTMTADIAARSRRTVWRIDLSFQLIGIPVEASAISQLLGRLNVAAPAFYRPKTSKSVESAVLYRQAWIWVTPVAWVLEPPEAGSSRLVDRWISGIVIRNPHIRARKRSERRRPPEWWPPALGDSEFILCSLGSWHTVGHPHGRYYLKRCEWSWSSDALVFCAIADWLDAPETARTKRANSIPLEIDLGGTRVRVVKSRPHRPSAS